MKEVLKTVTEWLSSITELLTSLIVFGFLVGIIYDDKFGVIEGVGNVLDSFGENGLAGFLALILVIIWYQKK